MALIPTLLAVAVGVGLGLRWGGEFSNVTRWQPVLWQALVGGVVVITLVDLAGITGGFGAFLVILATAAILAFTVLNIRVGGMVVIAAGVGLNLFVTFINWGRPVSASALVSAGIVKKSELGTIVLTGGRSTGDAILGFLGDVIPLPWGQVISFGDLLILIGTVLVTASVLRLQAVRGGMNPFIGRNGPAGYSNALDVLGRGPAPRRGPGLHPSRLDGPATRRNPRPGRHPR